MQAFVTFALVLLSNEKGRVTGLGSFRPLGEDSAFESLSKALEGATLEAFDCSGRALLKSTRARASHHGRADMLSMHDSMSTNHTEPLAMQEDRARTARKLLGLPMSRRERLQLTNKERARSERRARAKKRRMDLEEDTADSEKVAKPKDTKEGGKTRRPHARRSIGQGADQRDRLATTVGARIEEALPAHAFTGAEAQEQGEATAESTEPHDTVSGMSSSHDETQSGAFDAGATGSQDRRLDNLSMQQSEELTNSKTQDAIDGQDAGLPATSGQEAQGLADLPDELGGSLEVKEDPTSGAASGRKSGNLASSQEGSRSKQSEDSLEQRVAKLADRQTASGEPEVIANTANEAALSLQKTSQDQSGMGAAANASRELMGYHSVDLKKSRADRQHKGVAGEEWRRRQSEVVEACKESWAAYAKHAMGFDELAPVSLKGKNSFGSLGAMVIDSLDTLWMFGLREEFQLAQRWVQSSLDLEQKTVVSFFETTIRLLGGLLSAFELSQEGLFLQKAQQLTDKLMISCEGNYTLCDNQVHLNDPAVQGLTFRPGKPSMLAEFASIQMEFKTLSHHVKDPKYAEKAEGMIKPLHAAFPDVGLLPLPFNQATGKPFSPDARNTSMLTMGAMADSAYEYFLKMWLLTGKQDEMYRQRWELGMDEAMQLLVETNGDGLTYVTSMWNMGVMPLKASSMEHLTCFLPGNIALGVMQKAVSPAKAGHYMELAEKLTYTCWQMYERTVTGLGVDVADFKNGTLPLTSYQPVNMLRPEAVESFFYLWRATKNPEYRDWGWAVFQAFRKHSRTPEGAYSSVQDVNKLPIQRIDTMESFWTAETLKYLWLLFGEDELLSLDEWVLNTEAHPFRINSA